jgi:hypothetical protein
MMEFENRGIPGAYFACSNFMNDARSATDWGMPGMRAISIPSDKWYTLRRDLDEIRPIAAQAMDDIIATLTQPLTAQEANPPQQKKEEGEPEFIIMGDSYKTALEKFNEIFLESHMGDGLPLVPPAAERVK